MTTRLHESEQEALDKIDHVRSRPLRFRDACITMAHGAGGKASATLVEGLFVPAFASEALAPLGDASTLRLGDTNVAVTTDSFVVRPLRFPGGSIGTLAVNGTVNDLAVSGARPQALTLALILEEGLDSQVLREEVEAIATAAAAAGVHIVSGDTKVVERGSADGMYVCTTGFGVRDERATLSAASLQPGDRILVSGNVGDHGVAVMLARGQFELEADVCSDSRPLWPVVDALLDAAGPGVRCMRDATRGGLATVVNEFSRASGASMELREADVPVRPAVAGACEILGLDPLYVANEGTFVAIVADEHADAALEAMRSVPAGATARDIGTVTEADGSMVMLQTGFGGRRVLDMLVGDPLPRIC